MIRATIFDCDGVLVDSTKTSGDRFLMAAAERGLLITEEIRAQKDIIPKIGIRAIRKFWPDEDEAAFYRVWEDIDMTFPFEPIPGTRETFEDLRRRHYVSSVFSNRGPRTLGPVVERLGVAHICYKLWGCEGNGFVKPDPRSIEPLLRMYLSELNIRSDEVLLVGDSHESEWPVAYLKRLRFVGVLTGTSTMEDFLSAKVPAENIIQSIADLPTWLDNYDR